MLGDEIFHIMDGHSFFFLPSLRHVTPQLNGALHHRDGSDRRPLVACCEALSGDINVFVGWFLGPFVH